MTNNKRLRISADGPKYRRRGLESLAIRTARTQRLDELEKEFEQHQLNLEQTLTNAHFRFVSFNSIRGHEREKSF